MNSVLQAEHGTVSRAFDGASIEAPGSMAIIPANDLVQPAVGVRHEVKVPSSGTLQSEKITQPYVSGTPKFRRWITKGRSAAKAEQPTFNRALPDFVWVALPGVRMERCVTDQDWKAHVRHRRLFQARQ